MLDTWFSSALWPHSTLGWPDKTPELTYYYPTSVLVTSRDIITLWVARMVLTGLVQRRRRAVPRRLHPSEDSRRLRRRRCRSRKGNGVDPLDVIDKFGADALRFGLAYMTTETQDVRMPVEFECPHCQKLIEQTQEEPRAAAREMQALRQGVLHAMGRKPDDVALPRGGGGERAVRAGAQFLQQAVERRPVRADESRRLHARRRSRTAICWSKTAGFSAGWRPSPQQTTHGVGRVSLCRRGAGALRFCLGRVLQFLCRDGQDPAGDPGLRPAAQRVLAHMLDTLLRLLHPMVPFITEEIWQLLAEAAPERGIDCARAGRPRAS